MNAVIKKHHSDKLIDIEIIDPLINLSKEVVTRTVVRGIAIQGRKILLVYPKNDRIYGTPGGGVEAGENLTDTLKRELLEEVGAKDINIITYLGVMKSHRKDFSSDKIYSPIHHYYQVEIINQIEPKLVPYEKALELTNEYIDIDDAIKHNEKMIKHRNHQFLDFYTNQTIILKEIKKVLFN